MTDELELLKKDWQKKEAHLPKLSYEDIHKMIWKKSSSIVKWILIISVLEFVLPHLLYLLPSAQSSWGMYESLGILNYIIISSILQYSVVIYFIFQFYRRYKEISVLEDAKNLMKKIIKTRKTVKHYVIFSLSFIFFSFLIFAVAIYLTDDITPILNSINTETPDNISPEKLKTPFILGILIMGVVVTVFIGGIYFLLYGRLLKKLNKNYKELRLLEV